MLTFALVAWAVFGIANHTCRLKYQDLDCSSPCGEHFLGEQVIQNYHLPGTSRPSYPGPLPVDQDGVCVDSDQTEEIIEADHECPVTCAKTIARPAQLYFKARVPCDILKSSTEEEWAGNGTFRIFDTYSIVLGSGSPRPLHISFTFDGTTWSESIVDVQGNLYANSKSKDDDFFHEVMFDLAKDGTRIYYNGFLLKAMSLGEAEYLHQNEGRIELKGATQKWYNTVLVKDNSCDMACSSTYDCSGRGTTSGNNLNGCDCQCQCDENGCWGGPDCSTQRAIRLDDNLSCEEEFTRYVGNGWEDCFNLCHNVVKTCGYFAYDVENCVLFEECAPKAAEGFTLYQNSERMCYDETTGSMGSAYVRLQNYKKFSGDGLEVYFQTPDTYDLVDLKFREASHACGQWNPPITEDEECRNRKTYWTPSSFGCLTLYTGTFPMREIYNLNDDINYAGFVKKGSMLRSILMAEVQEISVHDKTAVKRNYHYIMPFSVEVEGTIALTVSAEIQNQCEALGTENCEQCQTCDPSTGACVLDVIQDNRPCNDNNPHTWPDYCTQGTCTGPLLCEERTCGECEICIARDVGSPECNDGEACVVCEAFDESRNFLPPAYPCNEGMMFEDICIDGECFSEEEECTCSCDPIDCSDPSNNHPICLCKEMGCGCDHRNCKDIGIGISCCDAGYCRQDELINPKCRKGYCSQVNAHRPRCNGGYCDQTGATSPTCDGGYCNQDDSKNPSCNGGFCTQRHAQDPQCSQGCEEDACSDKECEACYSCSVIDGVGVCGLDDSAGGCPACESCHDGICIPLFMSDGNRCDDGDDLTYHDECKNGVCQGVQCHSWCPRGGCNQDNTMRPCCSGGNCSQRSSSRPMCQGGNCDQRGANYPYCDGGGCQQENAVRPQCALRADCSGNCDLMNCGQCKKCVEGQCLIDQMATTCDLGYAYINEQCYQGECSGMSIACLNKECNECTTCVEGVCEIIENMIGVPCGDPDLDFKCNLGRCMPRIQPATLIDRFIMEVGVQEADMATMKSIIELGGGSSLNYPWYIVEDEDTFHITGTTEAVEDVSFTIKETCEHIEDQTCTQSWDLRFTVDKMCDDVSQYQIYFALRSRLEPDKKELLAYNIFVAQAAACGVVISEGQIQAELMITDETYENPNSFPYINIGKKIYFHLTVDTLAPIDHLEVQSMNLEIGGNSYEIIGPSLREDTMQTKLEVAPVNEGKIMKWYVYLHPEEFRNVDVGSSARMNINIEVRYVESNGRRRLILDQSLSSRRNLIAVDGYDFASLFYLLEYRCTDEASGKEALMETYIEVDCPPHLGRGIILMYCGTTGWQEDDFRNFCAGPEPVLDEAQFHDSSSSLPWYVWFGISLLGTASMILLYSWAPQEKINIFCSKLFGVDPPGKKKKVNGKHHKNKKKHSRTSHTTKNGETSQNGEPDHEPMVSQSSAASNPRSSGSEGHNRHSRKRQSINQGCKKKKKHRKSIRRSMVMPNAPMTSSGPKKSMLARQSLIRGDLPGSSKRKSVMKRKSLMSSPGGRKSMMPPKLMNQMSKKEAMKAGVIPKGTYTTLNSIADAQKLKKQFEKNMQLYE